MPVHGTCLQKLAKSDDPTRAGDALTVRAYDENLLHVCQPGTTSVDLEPLLDPETVVLAQNPVKYILDPDGLLHADDADIQSYTDPLLEVRAEQLKLILNLKRKGLICFRRNRVCIIGPFTVDKKGVRLRLVFDCRHANFCCRRPPKTFLSTPCALSRIRLCCSTRNAGGDHTVRRQYVGHILAIDLVDSL